MTSVLAYLANLFDQNSQQLCGLLAVTAPKEPLPSSSAAGPPIDAFGWITLDNLLSADLRSREVIAVLRGVERMLDLPELHLAGAADLRDLARTPNSRSALNQTRYKLAEYFGSAFTDDAAALQTALSWAVEYRLTGEDVANLVAILPCSDVHRFLTDGTAIRVYRSHTYHPKTHLWMGSQGLQAASAAVNSAVDEYYSLAHLPPETIDGFTPGVVFTFPLLEDYFLEHYSVAPADLMQSLHRAGHTRQLAQTLFLLSRDFLVWRKESAERQHFHPDRQQVIDLALRATMLYGTLSPELLTTGEDFDFALNCYGLLINALSPKEPASATDPANRALAYWFGLPRLPWLANTAHPEQASPEESGEAFREMLDEILRIGAGSLGSTLQFGADAGLQLPRRLFQVAHILNRSSTGQGGLTLPGAVDVADIDHSANLAQVVRACDPLIFPSPLFTTSLQTYAKLSTRWLDYLKGFRAYKVRRTDEVDNIQSKYRELFNNLQLPAHEQFLMRQALQRDWAEIESHRKALGTGPDVKIYLRSPWATQGITENLYFDVTNEGDAVARDVTVRLDPRSGFDLMPSNDAQPSDYEERKLGDLSPDETRRVSWRFCPRENAEHMRLLVHHVIADSARTDFEWGNIPIQARRSGQSLPLIHSYHAGPVVSKADFYGRQAEILRLLSRLRAGNHTLIYGPRRTGKTSALHELKAVLEDPREMERYNVPPALLEDLRCIYPVEISLQTPSADTGNPTRALFQHEILDKVYRALKEEPPSLTGLESRFVINPVGTCLDALKELFARHEGDRIAMLVDEWDRLYIPGFADLATNLRSLILYEPHITWFFTSTYAIVLEAQRGGSPLHNILARLKMDAMSEEDAWQLIRGPGLNANMGWQGGAALLVSDKTGRWPYLIQAAGLQIMETYEKENSTLIDDTKVPTILDGMALNVSSRKEYFGYLWDLTRSEDIVFFEPMSWMGRMILWALLESSQKEASSKPRTADDLYRWIITHLRDHRNEWEHSSLAGPNPLPNLPDLEDHFERELTRLDIAFGVIRELPNHTYTFAVPLMETALEKFIDEEKNLIHDAYLGLSALGTPAGREPPEDDEFLQLSR